jgi:surface protein
MSSIFRNAVSFNQPIGSWNTGNVTNMQSMFQTSNELAGSPFNQNISNWDTSKVTNMSSMFFRANDFSQDISNWDIRQVTTMASMFTSGSSWGTSNYDSSLIAWSQLLSPRNNVVFGVGTNKYSSSATSARNTLTSTYGWTINDGGLV